MAIQVQCTSCGKTYNADEKLAGRRIRCRQCGATFQIPAPPSSEEEGAADLNALASLEHSHAGESMLAGSGVRRPPAGATRDFSKEYPTEEEDDSGPSRITFKYPGSAVVDRWLPVILTLGGLAMVGLSVYHNDDTGQMWMIASRIVVLFLAYFAVLVPMGLKGIEMAARDFKFGLPRDDSALARASFMPAFVLGVIFWNNGGTSALVLGLILGFVLSCFVMFLLFKLQPTHLAAAAGYSAGTFAAGLAIAGGVLFGLNYGTQYTLDKVHKIDMVPSSPIAAGFAWPEPPRPAPIVARKPPPAPVIAQTQPEAPTTQTVVAAQPQNATPTTTPAVATDDNKLPNFMGVGDNKGQGNSTDQSNLPPASPLVDSITMASIPEDFDQMVRPLTPSSWALLSHRNGERGQWDRVWVGAGAAPDETNAWTTDGTVPYEPQENARFALSPDGDLLAHVATFPTLSVQLYSFKKKTSIAPLKLDPNLGLAAVVGFSMNDRLLVRRTLNNLTGCELWDVHSGTRLHAIDTPSFDPACCDAVVSPDGTVMAISGPDKPGGTITTIYLCDLGPGGTPRRLPVSDLPSGLLKPTGMAISNDNSKVAVLYEHGLDGLLFVCAAKNRAVAFKSQPLTPMPAQAEHGFTGSSLLWLSDNAIALYGEAVIDVNSGANLGDLGVQHVIGQHFMKPDLCELAIAPDHGQRQIATLKLKMDQIKGDGK